MTDDNMKMIGEAILFSAIQFSIGSVEMSSKFSVRNFAKDKETLECAEDALNDYMIIGIVWAIGVCALLYSNFGYKGATTALVANVVIMMWIYYSYQNAFNIARKKYKLNST